MEELRRRASEVAYYLQRLTDPAILEDVQNAVLRRDKVSFVKACKKAKIPHTYVRILVGMVFLNYPLQGQWP